MGKGDSMSGDEGHFPIILAGQNWNHSGTEEIISITPDMGEPIKTEKLMKFQ